ncbi:MAG: hypothetical protein ACTS27_00790 [Phycisphaerales bacterium]
MSTKIALTSAAIALALGASAGATITVTQGSSAPTYANTLTFDEPGAPTGDNVASDAFTAYGISSLVSGEGGNFVGSLESNPAFSWLGDTNVFYGPFGVFINLDQDATAFSMQYWDSSGPPSGFSGGAAVVVFNDGVEVGSWFGTPAFGGFGDAWFDIVATDGMVFDEVRALGFGFFPEAVVDNLSWQVVPAPGAGAILGLAGLAAIRRRRA